MVGRPQSLVVWPLLDGGVFSEGRHAARTGEFFALFTNIFLKFRAPLVLERQQPRSRRPLVHANAPVMAKWSGQDRIMAATATTVRGIPAAPDTRAVRLKIRLHCLSQFE